MLDEHVRGGRANLKKLFMEHLKKENNIRAKNQSKIKSLCAKANE